jgi:SAM-dependent methyltransferase
VRHMPRPAVTTISPNTEIKRRRLGLESPARRGQYMSRGELADAINRAMADLYPADKIAHLLVDERWVGEMERGANRWPREPRRAALRRVFGVASDAALGLVKSRGTGDVRTDGALAAAPGATPVPGAAGVGAPMPTQWAGQRDSEGTGCARAQRYDISTAHPARRYNYWLGGKDNFPADRASGDLIAAAFPTVVSAAWENRAFLRRAVADVTRAGIRQILDIGCGLPVPGNTHEIAQRIAPETRVVYVDHDPLVMSYARALLCGDPRGRIGYLEADVRAPEELLEHSALASVLDLRQPVAVLLVAVLHFIHDDDEATRIVRSLARTLPSGSRLVISHATTDFSTAEERGQYEQMFAAGQIDARARTRQQVGRFFDGLELVEPGIVAVTQWRPDEPGRPRASPSEVAIYGAVGRVP